MSEWNIKVGLVEQTSAGVGLCASCTQVRRITSDRGAVFYLCTLSALDPRFPKYPGLPVFSCSGYEKRSEESEPKLKPELNSGREPHAGRSCEKDRD
jgi:hypothetical protein